METFCTRHQVHLAADTQCGSRVRVRSIVYIQGHPCVVIFVIARANVGDATWSAGESPPSVTQQRGDRYIGISIEQAKPSFHRFLDILHSLGKS